MRFFQPVKQYLPRSVTANIYAVIQENVSIVENYMMLFSTMTIQEPTSKNRRCRSWKSRNRTRQIPPYTPDSSLSSNFYLFRCLQKYLNEKKITPNIFPKTKITNFVLKLYQLTYRTKNSRKNVFLIFSFDTKLCILKIYLILYLKRSWSEIYFNLSLFQINKSNTKNYLIKINLIIKSIFLSPHTKKTVSK